MYKDIKSVVSEVIGYLLAIALCLFFALYMSAAIGWTMIYILVAAPVFSAVITLVICKGGFIEFSSEASSEMLYKGETVTLTVNVKNNSVFPVPAVLVRLKAADGLERVEKISKRVFAVSVSPRSVTSFKVTYKALHWGRNTVGIENVSAEDFMHFFSLCIFNDAGGMEHSDTVKVFPDIPDVPSDAPLIRTVAQSVRFFSDSEETRENDKIYAFSGMPGYNHREYAQGDPIRRINWKLSSKRDVYMIRLDDEKESVRQTIVLDCYGKDVAENERAVEGILAMTYSLVRMGLDAVVWYRTKNGFEQTEIESKGDITALQTAFAEYDFVSRENVRKPERIPVDELRSASHSSILFYTPCVDRALAESISTLSGGMGVTIAAASLEAVAAENCSIWLLAEDYSAELIS